MGTISGHQITTFTVPVNATSPIDANAVRGNDNTIKTTYNLHDADATIHLQTGAVASRPAAGTAGRTWLATDTGALYLWLDTGAAWVEASYLRATGGTVSGLVTVTDGTTNPLPTQLGFGVAFSTTNATGSRLGLGAYLKQTVASTGGVQGIEGYVAHTHTSGTVVQSIGAIGNVDVSGVGGTITNAIGVQSGGNLSAGTVTNFFGMRSAAPGSGATITNAYGFYADALTLASNNYAFYSAGTTQSSLGGALTVRSGGLTVTGNSTITGTLGGITGLTVASGGVTVTTGGLTVTGNSTITGTLGGVTILTATTSVVAPLLSLPNTGGAATVGTLTLSGGTKTVATTAATSTCKIFFSYKSGAGSVGRIVSYSVVNGTSFTASSNDAGDSSDVNWWIVETH